MKTQKQIILDVLQENPNTWLPMPHLAKQCRIEGNSESYAVHSRIADIRKEGYEVLNKTEQLHGRRQSYYKLVEMEPA